MTGKIHIYIAGPLESAKRKDFNFPIFDFVASKLRAKNHEVFSPADFTRELIGGPEEIDKLSDEDRRNLRGRLLARELTWICLQADVVYMLPGWEQSPGATAERYTALAMKKPVHEIPAEYLPEVDNVEE
jgi:Domain of unknown function (DUF4406)